MYLEINAASDNCAFNTFHSTENTQSKRTLRPKRSNDYDVNENEMPNNFIQFSVLVSDAFAMSFVRYFGKFSSYLIRSHMLTLETVNKRHTKEGTTTEKRKMKSDIIWRVALTFCQR